MAPTPQACPRGERHTLHAGDLASVPRLGSRRPPRLLEMERRYPRAPGRAGGGAPWVGAPARTTGHGAAEHSWARSGHAPLASRGQRWVAAGPGPFGSEPFSSELIGG